MNYQRNSQHFLLTSRHRSARLGRRGVLGLGLAALLTPILRPTYSTTSGQGRWVLKPEDL